MSMLSTGRTNEPLTSSTTSGLTVQSASPALDVPSALPPHVVLLDAYGRSLGVASKSVVHHASTPLHLAFSCYVVGADGRVLITRRSTQKRTWPGVWTNSCCGHPRLDERLDQAVTRHLRDELQLEATRMTLAVADFAYRAVMDDGTVEHELCPVIVAEVAGEPAPDDAEVEGFEWVTWTELVARATRAPESLSPWSVAQIAALDRAGCPPKLLLDRRDAADSLLATTWGARSLAVPDAVDALSLTRRRVDAHLSAFMRDRRDDVPEAGDATEVLAGVIEALANGGGKRLRPAFLMWGHVAAGGEISDDGLLNAAAAVEMLHTFALLHDDVMDRSALRRGRPTAHHALQSHHRGDPDGSAWFGVSAAVLAGDLAFVWADSVFDRLHEAGIDPRDLANARRLFTRLRTEVIAGQLLDLQVGCCPEADEPDALRIALLKSARYTATRPLQIGAALAGAEEDLLAGLAEYGDAAGMAFQLRDDVLGMFGDPSVTGKGAIDDLREGKRTLLVLRALKLTTDAGRATLERALGKSDLEAGEAERCVEIIAASGALASVEAAIDAHLTRAVDAASRFDLRATDVLTRLALQAARRDS
jgi:isopentenyl-diphosphate delta-isomerase type 1